MRPYCSSDRRPWAVLIGQLPLTGPHKPSLQNARHPEGGVSGSPAETLPALLGTCLPAGSIQSLRHSSGATANVCGPGRRRRHRKRSLEPGAWSLEPGGPEHPASSPPPPAPPNTLGLTPASSHSLLTRSPAPTDIHRRVCTLAHACMHTAHVKARPLTDRSASPRPGGRALPSPCLTARWTSGS